MKRKLITLLVLTVSFILIDALYSGSRACAEGTPQAGQAYVIREHDNLFRIAERAYGNGFDYYRILEANPWVDPDRLIPGKRIEIPAIAAPTSPIPPENLADELRAAGALEPATPGKTAPRPPRADTAPAEEPRVARTRPGPSRNPVPSGTPCRTRSNRRPSSDSACRCSPATCSCSAWRTRSSRA